MGVAAALPKAVVIKASLRLVRKPHVIYAQRGTNPLMVVVIFGDDSADGFARQFVHQRPAGIARVRALGCEIGCHTSQFAKPAIFQECNGSRQPRITHGKTEKTYIPRLWNYSDLCSISESSTKRIGSVEFTE
jgi:hypothetical protein